MRFGSLLQFIPSVINSSVASSLDSQIPFTSVSMPSCTLLDPAAYPSTPANLALEQVHIYIRHGERAPVGVRLNNAPASIPQHWFLCDAGRKFSAAVWDPNYSSQKQSTVNVRRVVERRDGTALPGECMLGELTDLGRQSTFAYGEALRKLYIKKLEFLPDKLGDHSAVYYRSTNVPRTIESLQQIIHGLYPTSKLEGGIRPQLLVRNGKDENLISNHFACKRLERLSVAWAQATAEALNPQLAPLDRRISRYIDGNPIRIDGRPRASGILDTIKAAKAHGFRVPKEFNDPEIMDLLEYAVVTEWFGGYKTQEYRRLAMGPLLHDLQQKMQKKVDYGDKEPLKLLIHSTHDTALAGIASTLDVFDLRWPEFTASITFELFKQKKDPQPSSLLSSLIGKFTPTTPSEYFIRMRYQNKSLPLPSCAAEGKHLPGSPEFCTLKAFQEYVKELTPEDWDKECIPPRTNVTL